MSFEIFSPTPDMLQTAIMPIAQQVFANVLDKVDMENFFKGNIDFESYGYTHMTTANDGRNPELAKNQAAITVNYSFNKDELHWPTAGAAIEYQQVLDTPGISSQLASLFVDNINGIRVVEYARPMSVTMDCELLFTDAVKALECYQRMATALSYGVGVMELDFSYHIPFNIYGTLFQLYKMHNGDGEGFHEYLSDHSNDIIGRSINRHDMSDTAISARRSMSNVLYGFSLKGSQPEPVGSTKSPDGYVVSVEIGSQVMVANLLGLVYPIVINNTLIPNELTFPSTDKLKVTDVQHPFLAVDEFRKLLLNEPTSRHTKRYPEWDNWLCPQELGFTPFLTSVILLDDIENPNGITSFNIESAFSEIVPEAIAIMKHDGIMCLGYNSMISVAVYKDDIKVTPEFLIYDEDLNMTISERDTSYIYRIVLSVNFNKYHNYDVFKSVHIDIVGG